jgi:hypothetical protein
MALLKEQYLGIRIITKVLNIVPYVNTIIAKHIRRVHCTQQFLLQNAAEAKKRITFQTPPKLSTSKCFELGKLP